MRVFKGEMLRHLPFFYVVATETQIHELHLEMKYRFALLILLPALVVSTYTALLGDLHARNTEEEPAAVEGVEVLAHIQDRATEEEWSLLPFNELIAHVGMELRGIPYSGGTLEGSVEKCRVSLKGLDCVTFFESSLAIARLIRVGTPLDASHLQDEVQRLRYRGGVVEGYTSRLHYFVDWGSENQVNGVVHDITGSFERASPDNRRINFMSNHVNAYAALKESPENVERIMKIEDAINSRKRHYLKKAYIGETEENLLTGDIIGITTTIQGLDVSHTGMVYRDEEGRVRLLHASLKQKKVILDVELAKYLAGNRKQTGIIVLRPIDPLTSK